MASVRTLCTLSVLVCAGLIISGIAPTTQAQADNPDIVVSPGESIQTAINDANPGDTIQLEEGTYEQSIVIDKDLRITTSGEATLDGDTIEAEDGIIVDATDVTIEDIEVARFDDDGINVKGNVLDQRRIEIVNVTTRLNGNNNIEVAEGNDRDTVILRNVESNRAGFNGIVIEAENVTIENTVSQLNDDVGVDITAGADGEIAIRGSEISDTNDDEGLIIRSANNIDIEDTEVSGSDDEGIKVLSTDAISGGRTVTLSNVTSQANGFENIEIGGTSDPDTVVLTEIVSSSAGFNGVDIEAEDVTVEDTVIEGADDKGLGIIAGAEGSVTIQDSEITNSGDDEGILIESANDITINETQVAGSDATGIELASTDATAGGRTVTLSNVTSQANGFENFFIGGTNGEDSAVLTDVISSSAGFNGIEVQAENVILERIVSEGSDDRGLDITAGDQGSVTIQNGEISNTVDDEGIFIESAKNITINETEVAESDTTGIELASTDATAGGRTVTLSNVTSRANTFENIFIGGTNGEDSVVLNDVVSTNSGFNGISIEAKDVTINNMTNNGAADYGLEVTAGAQGQINIQESIISGNGNGDNDDGVVIRSAREITIEDTELTGNNRDGITIEDTSATFGGRTILFNNVTAQLNGEVGAVIGETSDSDSVSIADAQFDRNNDEGILISTESSTVSQTRITNNTGPGIIFRPSVTSGTITQSSILNNGGPEVENQADDVTIDATNNWWGDPSGPDESDLIGDVNTSDPLSVAPTVKQSVSLEPTSASATVGETVVYDVVVENVTNGVGAYNLTVSTDPTVATITGVEIRGNPSLQNISFTEDNSSVSVSAANANTADVGAVEIAKIALTGQAESTTDVTLSAETIGDEDGEAYSIGAVRSTTLVIENQTGPGDITGNGNAAVDPDGDGVFEDVNGDGSVDVLDVQALFTNLDSKAVADNTALDINGDGSVNVLDVQALFTQL